MNYKTSYTLEDLNNDIKKMMERPKSQWTQMSDAAIILYALTGIRNYDWAEIEQIANQMLTIVKLAGENGAS